jgi:hypothetical protein
MSAPIHPSQVRPQFTTRPPPTELLARTYFPPLVAPTPVGTRVPRPSNTEDTINGFLRVEAGGGVLRADGILWDVAIILHAYAPNTQEAVAEQLITAAVAWGGNAQGVIIPVGSDNWYVTYSRVTGFIVRKADPLVAMTRYRAMVTWRVPGIPVVPGQPFRAVVEPDAADQAVVAQQTAHRSAPRPSRRR